MISGDRLTHVPDSVDAPGTESHPGSEARIQTRPSHDGVAEALGLQPCNRVEQYGGAETCSDGREVFRVFP